MKCLSVQVLWSYPALKNENKMKKRILLVNPPPNGFRNDIEIMHPNGALLLIGEMCKQRGHEVRIVEMAAYSIDISALREIIFSFNPDIVGISMSTFQTDWANEICITTKKISDASVVVGGAHPSAIGKEIFKEIPNADISVIGEGEFTFLEIVEGKRLEEIKGICYKGKMNELREPIMDFNYIPLPNLDMIDFSKFSGTTYWGGSQKSMYIMASRGCPFRCIFCSKSVFRHKVRFREPKKVMEEIKWLHEQYDIVEICFDDDLLNLNKRWIKDIFELIIANNLNNIRYKVAFRVNKNLVDREILSLAKKAGVRIIFYGVESGSPKMLKNMKKDITVEEIERAFRLTHEAGIETVASFVIGLPGENEKTINETINLWRRLKPTYAGIGIAYPLPDTEFLKIVKERKYLVNNKYDDYRYGGNYGANCIRTEELTTKQLNFFSPIIQFGFHNHEWIFKLPIFVVANNRLLCGISLLLIKIIHRAVRFFRYNLRYKIDLLRNKLVKH